MIIQAVCDQKIPRMLLFGMGSRVRQSGQEHGYVHGENAGRRLSVAGLHRGTAELGHQASRRSEANEQVLQHLGPQFGALQGWRKDSVTLLEVVQPVHRGP